MEQEILFEDNQYGRIKYNINDKLWLKSRILIKKDSIEIFDEDDKIYITIPFQDITFFKNYKKYSQIKSNKVIIFIQFTAKKKLQIYENFLKILKKSIFENLFDKSNPNFQISIKEFANKYDFDEELINNSINNVLGNHKNRGQLYKDKFFLSDKFQGAVLSYLKPVYETTINTIATKFRVENKLVKNSILQMIQNQIIDANLIDEKIFFPRKLQEAVLKYLDPIYEISIINIVNRFRVKKELVIDSLKKMLNEKLINGQLNDERIFFPEKFQEAFLKYIEPYDEFTFKNLAENFKMRLETVIEEIKIMIEKGVIKGRLTTDGVVFKQIELIKMECPSCKAPLEKSPPCKCAHCDFFIEKID